MKEVIANAVVENSSCCPKCDIKTRVIGFIITFFLGFILMMMSFGALGGLVIGQVNWFAFLNTLGNITSLCS